MSRRFDLHLTPEGKELEHLSTLQMLNPDGQIMVHQSLDRTGSGTPVSVQIPELESGVYLLKLSSANRPDLTQKLIILKRP